MTQEQPNVVLSIVVYLYTIWQAASYPTFVCGRICVRFLDVVVLIVTFVDHERKSKLMKMLLYFISCCQLLT